MFPAPMYGSFHLATLSSPPEEQCTNPTISVVHHTSSHVCCHACLPARCKTSTRGARARVLEERNVVITRTTQWNKSWAPHFSTTRAAYRVKPCAYNEIHIDDRQISALSNRNAGVDGDT